MLTFFYKNKIRHEKVEAKNGDILSLLFKFLIRSIKGNWKLTKTYDIPWKSTYWKTELESFKMMVAKYIQYKSNYFYIVGIIGLSDILYLGSVSWNELVIRNSIIEEDFRWNYKSDSTDIIVIGRGRV